jgi:flagellar basal-body rod protein FlgF
MTGKDATAARGGFMLRGIYTGASGMLAQQARMDSVANNLANVDQTGFKKDTTLFKAFPDMIIRRVNDDGLGITPAGSYDSMPYVGKLGTGVEVNEVFTQFEQGGLEKTENNFDFALEGKGFFAVLTEKGERYTRNGSFTLNQDGILVTHDGYQVMGENGPISIQRNNVMVDEKGVLKRNDALSGDPKEMVGLTENSWENPGVLDKLKVVTFENMREIKKEGNSFYRDTEYSGPAIPAEDYKVIQGFREKSNVSVVREMVEMIEVQRAYEANQKTIQTGDATVGKLINEIVR